MSNFIVQVLQGNDITLYRDGLQSRALCYVDDLIECLVRLFQSPENSTGPVNIGNPEEFTMRARADAIVELTGSH